MSVATVHHLQAGYAAQVEQLALEVIRTRGLPTTAAQAQALADELHPMILATRRDMYRAQAVEVGRIAAEHGYQVPLRRPRYYSPEATRRLVRVVSGLEPGKGQKVAIESLDNVSRAARRASAVLPYTAADNPTVQDAFAARLAAQAARHARQAARDAVRDFAAAGLRDRNGYPTRILGGWARVLTGAENCPFCVMLASRGPVYSGGGGKRGKEPGAAFHENCDCSMVFVVEGKPWEGEQQYKNAEKMWHDAATITEEDREAGRLSQQQRFDHRARQAVSNNPDLLVAPSLREG